MGIIAYASANLVCILDQHNTAPRVLFTLNEHKERVNGVKWLSKTSLVSVSADKSIVVWSCEAGGERDYTKWRVQ